MKTSVNTSSVNKAFVLLEFLAARGGPATLQDVTDAVKLAKPTARLTCADPQVDLKSRAKSVLRRLYEEFNETVNLGILSGGQVLYLDYLETTQPLRYIVTPGQSDPWFCTALGRAAAAQLPDKALNRLIAETKLHSITPATIRTRAALLRAVEQVRTDGYAHEFEESVEGVCCLAVGLAPLGFSEAAISVALPVKRLTTKRKAAILKMFSTLVSS
jgi:DNA-binding IclR family transcriptional regulator